MTTSPSSDQTELRIEHFSGAGGLPLVASVGGQPGQPAVVLLHGGGQTRHSWGGTARLLAGLGYHAIALDARGHGDSGWSPEAAYTYEDMADDLDQVVAGLPHKPVLIGASMGGMTALQAVGRRSGSAVPARALVLVDIAPRNNPVGVKRIVDFMTGHPDGFADVEQAADAVAAYNPHRPRPRDPSGLMKNLRLREDGRLRWHWDPQLFSHRSPEQRAAAADRLIAVCAHITIPALLVHGEQSDIVTSAGIDELRQQMPQLESASVPGAGHMIAGDRNDTFNGAILPFLRRHLAV